MEIESIPTTPLSKPASSIELAYVYAQKLNNNAALCIGCGQYQRAEASLTKALHLSKLYMEQKERGKTCNFNDCSVDGCIIFTEDSDRAMRTRRQSKAAIAKRDVIHHHAPDSIYRRPIQVPCRQTADGHTMGKALSLVIVFNMGMALHLRALEKANSNTERRSYLEKSRRLYESAYMFLHQGENSRCESIQFRMILSNNLYHVNQHMRIIHSATGMESYSVDTQQQKYLDELLSTLLCVAEQKNDRSRSVNDSNHIHFTGMSTPRRFINLEGFWQTVEHLVLKAHCAEAA